MVVQVCIGSACHLKGSYDVIKSMQKFIEEENLDSRVTLKSSFCLGECSDAVSVRVNDDPVESVTPEQAKSFLKKQLGME